MRKVFRKLLDDYEFLNNERQQGVTVFKSIDASPKLQLSMLVVTRKNIRSKLIAFVLLPFCFILNTFVVDMFFQDNKYQQAKPAFTCSKSTMETPEECVKYMFKINHKSTKDDVI